MQCFRAAMSWLLTLGLMLEPYSGFDNHTIILGLTRKVCFEVNFSNTYVLDNLVKYKIQVI